MTEPWSSGPVTFNSQWNYAVSIEPLVGRVTSRHVYNMADMHTTWRTCIQGTRLRRHLRQTFLAYLSSSLFIIHCSLVSCQYSTLHTREPNREVQRSYFGSRLIDEVRLLVHGSCSAVLSSVCFNKFSFASYLVLPITLHPVTSCSVRGFQPLTLYLVANPGAVWIVGLVIQLVTGLPYEAVEFTVNLSNRLPHFCGVRWQKNLQH